MCLSKSDSVNGKAGRWLANQPSLGIGNFNAQGLETRTR